MKPTDINQAHQTMRKKRPKRQRLSQEAEENRRRKLQASVVERKVLASQVRSEFPIDECFHSRFVVERLEQGR